MDDLHADESVSDEHRAYLELMAREAGVELPSQMTAAEAEEWRAELQRLTGRGATDPAEQSLGQRVENAGVVDPQAMILPDA